LSNLPHVFLRKTKKKEKYFKKCKSIKKGHIKIIKNVSHIIYYGANPCPCLAYPNPRG
jgi:hypothetical protein